MSFLPFLLSGIVAVDGDEPVQMKLFRSLKLWTFYVDLEESLGTLESTRAVYERILDLRIATPQIILNFAYFLEVGAVCSCHDGCSPSQKSIC